MGLDSIPGWRTKIPQALVQPEKRKENEKLADNISKNFRIRAGGGSQQESYGCVWAAQGHMNGLRNEKSRNDLPVLTSKWKESSDEDSASQYEDNDQQEWPFSGSNVWVSCPKMMTEVLEW